jgi:hypothetical protein
MIQISTTTKTTRTIRPGDSDFIIQDGLTVVPRAGFELTASCPIGYRDVIMMAINQGYLTPIATVRDSEYMWDQLGD